uniref:Uncharacterized protein n=1 Tax=Chromera velia CCMP2878 TaxID=1169474 RepID=A0A0G4I9Z9_9ALVE|eukprot:Cvel_12406.t1-p1 / transcript=Cvel_12406.t1 / gene=Cvel_12406 / organism=Chromera_velia_CCMP2878 / gene_product=hypothetical protein / transcript_product=hypothetical protein / location=Cvel_scaffold811:50026-51072(+) / protein_length=349 / sequence_SO=supercontig / SO=protein_coding / is_pseudo=false
MKEAILTSVREEFETKFTALDEKLDLILKAQQPKQEEAKPAKANLPSATLTLPRQAPQQKQEDEDDSPVSPLVDSPKTPVYETRPSQPHTVAFPPSRFFPPSSPKKKGKKVDMSACLKFESKTAIKTFHELWSSFQRVYLKRENFASTQEWRDQILLALKNASNGHAQFKTDVRRMQKGKNIPIEKVVDYLVEDYMSAVLAQQLSVQDLLDNFPWKRGEEHRRDRRDHLSWVELDKRMEDVIVQAGDIEWEITDKQKVNAFVGALSLEQKKEYLHDHRLQRRGVKIADLNELTWKELEDGIKFYVSIEKLEDKHCRGRQDGCTHHPRREETAFTGRGQHHSHHHYHQGQ